MSTHMLIAAAYVEDLDASAKLVLMAFADSGDEHTQETAPGLPKLRAWSGLSKSQVTRVTGQLVDAELLARVERARLGRRAVYRVFPRGVPAIPHPDEVAARYPTTSSPPVDNSQVPGAHPRAPRGASASSWGAPMRPLQSFSSVTSAPHRQKPRRGVDKSTPGGFPGSRQTTASGPAPSRCPDHPAEFIPCDVCYSQRSSPGHARAAAAAIRELMARPAPPPGPPDPTHQPDQE